MSNTTVITYNALSQKTAMSDPDMGHWTYQYDPAGNLITQTDALNNALWFKYDALNRLVEKRQTGSGGTLLASYGYGATAPNIGYRLRLDDPSGYSTWAYDVLGRMTQETKVISNTGGGTFVTQWNYDALDRPVWMKYPGGNAGQVGEQVNFTYNTAGQVNSVIGASPYVQSTAYDAAGRVDLRVLGGNVVQQDYVYYPWTTANGQGRLQQIKAGTPISLTALQDLNYTYDAVGNVRTIRDNKAGPQTQTFTYDALDRLQTAQATGGTGGTYSTETYLYDAVGNLKSKPGVGVYTYTASATGCVAGTPAIKAHAVSGAGTYTFGYDCNGNMLTRNDSTGAFTQQWDRENHLITVTGSASGSFVYDGDGNRVKATLNGVTTAYVGNYYEQSGSVTTTYYYAGGTRIAMRQGSTVSYLLGDHLGSTSITANSSGGLSAEQRYKPWGETRYTNGTTPTRRQYTGQINDSEIGLYFYGARSYSSVLGRFLSPDTVVPQLENPQAWNRYAYVVNNPLKYNDPTGHCFFICGIIGGAIGAVVGAVSYTANVITNHTGWDSNAYWASVGAGAGSGALIGSTLGVAAPVVAEATSVTLAGASAATGPGTLATAATSTYAAAGTMATVDAVALKTMSDGFSQINFAPASSPAPSAPILGTSSSEASTVLTNYWPSNRGFYGETTRTHLMPGEVVDRYGYEGGTFVSPKGTPFEMRALSPESFAKPYHAYEVMKPIESVSGITRPAFGQIGFGRAYELPRPVSTLLRRGFLREIDP